MNFQNDNLFQCLIKEQGTMDETVSFVMDKQLKNRALWQKFTEVFETREDSEAGRWRGEYFGKQIRGAALNCMIL